jgi:shikimate kinase
MAIFDLLGYDYYYYDILRINTSVSRKCGVSVTGALDDAAASLLGGLVVTDNRRDIILRRYTIDKYDVLLAYPEYGVKTSRYIDRDFTFIGGVLSMVTDMLYDGNWREAMTLNGIIYSSLLGYDVKPIYIALEAGAEAASLSGKGPSYAAVSSDVSSIEDVWSRSLDYKFIRTVVW